MPANRQNVPRSEREAEILTAARTEFAEVGFDAATMASIARRAGMTAANVHYYFATKDALFGRVADGAYDVLLTTLDGLDDEVERLRGYVTFHLQHHPMRAAFQALAARSPEVAAVIARREAWLDATCRSLGDDDLDAAAIAAVVTGLIEAAEPHPKPDAVIDRAVDRLAHRRPLQPGNRPPNRRSRP